MDVKGLIINAKSFAESLDSRLSAFRILPELVYAKVSLARSLSPAFAWYFGRLCHDKSLQMSQTKRTVCTQAQQDTQSGESEQSGHGVADGMKEVRK